MNLRFSYRAASRVVGAVALGASCWGVFAADEITFAGKKVEIIVPFSPGGGTDIYTRALAPHFEKHLPGNPTLIVRNIPGSRGIPGANKFEATAPTDGTMLIASSASTVANFVFQRSKVDYRLDKWVPVLLSPQGAVTYASTSLGIKGPKDIKQLQGKDLVFGGQSPSSAEIRAILPFELLGLKPRYVWGLNRGPVRLAFERGELNINYDSTPGYLKGALGLVKAGKAAPLYSLGVLDDKGRLVRDPNFPDLPSFIEAYETWHGKKPSGPAYQAYLSVMKMLVMLNKALFLPAGTPKAIQDVWAKSVTAMLADPEFAKTAGKIIEGYPQFVGEAARPIIKDATTFSPEAWSWLTAYLKKEHNVTVQ